MREELSTILRGAARKLLVTRSLEAAGVAGVGGGLAAAALLVAWLLAPISPAAAVGACALPIVLGAAVLHQERLRRVFALRAPQAGGLAVLGLAAGIFGGGAIVTGAWRGAGPAVGAIVLLAGAAAGGAILRLVRGVSVHEAAEFLDARAGLDERLGTAVERALDDPHGPLDEAVCAQALEILRRQRPQRRPMWRRTRATGAALLLMVLSCATLVLLGARGQGPPPVGSAELARALQGLSPEQRARVADSFRRAAASAEDAVAADLLRTATVVRLAGRRELERVLEKLRQAGLRPVSIVPRDLLLAAGIDPAAGGSGDEAGRKSSGGGRSQPPPRHRGPGAADPPKSSRVAVYHPGEDVPESATPSAGGGHWVPFAGAWATARVRAADALARGEVPARYRRIVRAFFAPEE